MHKFSGVAELFVDTGEAHVSDLIDTGESLHHGIADGTRWDLRIKLGFEDIDDVFHQHRDLLVVDGAFVAGGFDRAGEFLAIEIFAAAIAFDYGETFANEGFGGAEAVAAFQAFTTTANSVSFPANPGVGHFVLNRGAFRAAHGGRFGSVEREKVLKNFHAALSRDGLGVELHAPDGERLMPESHDFAFGGFGGDFEAIRAGFAFEDQGMVAGRGEALGESSENVGIKMLDGGSLAVHQAVGADDVTAEVMANRLMA